MKLKPTVELPTVSQSHQIADATSEFDDNEEIQVEEENAQHCRRRPNLIDASLKHGSGAQNNGRELAGSSIFKALAR
jgi:hypothetical protein